VTTARSVAVETVRRVTDEEAYSTRVLPALLERSRLSPRDRALATELSLGTLRHIPGLDRSIGLRATRSVARMSPGARAALRLGAYQLLFMRIPPHAAVSASVDLATPRERGFVNAILRSLADDPPAPPIGTTDQDVFARTGMSPWAVRELRLLLGDDEAEVAAEAFGERGLMSLRANTCRTSVEAFVRGLRASGHSPHPARLHPDCVLLDGGDPTRLRGFAQGWFAVQDQASAFVVRALDPQPGERVLDACAAPGGKAAHIACLVGETGVVVAADVRPERAALVRSTAQRLGVDTHVIVQDGTRPAVEGPFDRVLVDAPCSGIGSARRRPELLWRPRRADLSSLARLQVAIASAAAERLRPGGRLVYSVCTFPRAETDAACDALVRHRPELEPVPIDGPEGPSTRVRLWPHRHGSDGMFVAAFRKRL
jgi:16S rRNA (cytosine967-C5)-methyltransferase